MEDWEHLLDSSSDDANLIIPPNHHHSPLSVDDIEHLLFNDEDLDNDDQDQNAFLDHILLDSPLKSSSSSVDSDLNNETVVLDQQEEQQKDNDDPLAKKRKRQLRNRDAAVRSRERKKMHVKDLEMKSRYYEGECRRLGSLLHWYMAENQALRFSLHTATATSMTKQESAVLFLESLLLGSLLWLMVASLLVPVLQCQTQLVTDAVVEEEKHLPPTPRKGGGTKSPLSVGKRYKASRSRMRRFLVLPPVF